MTRTAKKVQETTETKGKTRYRDEQRRQQHAVLPLQHGPDDPRRVQPPRLHDKCADSRDDPAPVVRHPGPTRARSSLPVPVISRRLGPAPVLRLSEPSERPRHACGTRGPGGLSRARGHGGRHVQSLVEGSGVPLPPRPGRGIEGAGGTTGVPGETIHVHRDRYV